MNPCSIRNDGLMVIASCEANEGVRPVDCADKDGAGRGANSGAKICVGVGVDR